MHVCWFFTHRRRRRTWSHLLIFFWNYGRNAPYGGRDEESHTADERPSLARHCLPPAQGRGRTEEEGDIGLIEGCDRKAPIWGGGREDMAQ